MKIIKDRKEAADFLQRTSVEFEDTPAIKASIEQLFGEKLTSEQAVVRIIDAVRQRGDEALLELTAKIDGVKLSGIEVSNNEIAAAYDVIDDELLGALEL
ncbi:MAG: histidinol dehydrogenase, partial [Anaerolineales bacterium]|nr:histidinol dehydrogenase [Anaerolineales bacterium]